MDRIYDRNSCGRHNRRQTHRNPNRACFCRAAYRCTCSTSQQKSCERHTPLQNSRNSHTLPFGCAVYLNNCSRRHSSYCGRWHRWFRFSSVRRRTNSFCSHCWCKWRPAHFAIPMYGFRKRGKSSCRRYQGHALYIHKSPNSEHNGKGNTQSTADDRWLCVPVLHMCLEENFCRRMGNCRR